LENWGRSKNDAAILSAAVGSAKLEDLNRQARLTDLIDRVAQANPWVA
jgi:hypothetical protein